MADFSMKREVDTGTVRYRLEGVFTGEAAFELKRAIQAEVCPVELDFSRVHRFFDFGLAAFATELQAPDCKRLAVELKGLSLHHRRLLHYFGLELQRGDLSVNDDLAAEPAPPLRSVAPA